MRIWISAMLLASTAALGMPAFAQQVPSPGHDGGDRHDGDRGGGRGGDHRGGGDRGDRGGQSQGQAQGQAQRPPQGAPGGAPNGARPQGGQPSPARLSQPQVGRDDPRFRGGQGYQGDRGPGNDLRQSGRAGGDPRGNPGWQNRPGGGDGGRARDRQVHQDGRPGYAGQGYRHGGDDRGRGGGGNGGNWNRGWRSDNRYDWQGWRDQHREVYRGGGYRAPGGYSYGYRRFGIGVAIAPAFFAQQYWIADPEYYRLPPAYGPYRWVRYYNDALLIDIYSGVVVDSIPGFFW